MNWSGLESLSGIAALGDDWAEANGTEHRLARTQGKEHWPAAPHFVRRLIEITSRQQQTQRTLLDLLWVECEIEKPRNKLLAVAELDSDTWVGEVKRIRGKKLPLTATPCMPDPLATAPVTRNRLPSA